MDKDLDKELEEMLQFARLLSAKLRSKLPTDGRAKSYIIAARCMIDATVATMEEILKEEAENDVSGDD